MASEEPEVRTRIQARRHVAALRRTRPGVAIEIRWFPAHKGVPSSRGARCPRRGMAKLLGSGGGEGDAAPQISCTPEAGDLGAESWQWARGRASQKKYKLPAKQRPDTTVAGSSKRPASRFCRPKTGHLLPGSAYTGQRIGPPFSAGGPPCTGHRRGITSSTPAPNGRPSRRSCRQRCGRKAGGGRAGSRSGASLPIGGAARRYTI